jgi:hypothetical protein
MYVITRGQDQPRLHLATRRGRHHRDVAHGQRRARGARNTRAQRRGPPRPPQREGRRTSRYGPRRGDDCMDHRRQIKDYHRLLRFPPEAA